MPRLSVWFVRTALGYLAIGFTLGALMLTDRSLSLGLSRAQLLPSHIEFLLVGWMVQLTFGVAFWILPRFRRGPERGQEELVWLAYVLLNLGVIRAAAGPTLGLPAAVPSIGHLAQGVAAGAFALHAWPRVKMFGAES